MLSEVLETFDKVGQNGSTKTKAELLNSLTSDISRYRTAGEMLRYAYNPFITFGITRKEPKFNSLTYDFNDQTEWDTFKALLDLLRERKLTGNAAKDVLEQTLANFCESSQLWFTRILNKDLKIGVAETTINKHWPNLLPIFKPQLCETWEEGMFVQGKRYRGERKFDGFRVICIMDMETRKYQALSREGRQFFNLDMYITPELEKAFPTGVWVFDGECFGENWNLVSRLLTTPNPKLTNWQEELKKVHYHVFDVLTFEEWNTRKCTRPLWARHEQRDECVGLINSPYIERVDWVAVEDEAHALALIDQWEKAGYEGAVFKREDSMYAFGRTMDWLKAKNFYEDEFRIRPEWEYGKQNGAFAQTLGAIFVEGRVEWKGKVYDVQPTKVGGGYTVEKRDELLPLVQAGEHTGKIATVKFQEIGKNKLGEYRLRFPVFKCIRFDKTKLNLEN